MFGAMLAKMLFFCLKSEAVAVHHGASLVFFVELNIPFKSGT